MLSAKAELEFGIAPELKEKSKNIPPWVNSQQIEMWLTSKI